MCFCAFVCRIRSSFLRTHWPTHQRQTVQLGPGALLLDGKIHQFNREPIRSIDPDRTTLTGPHTIWGGHTGRRNRREVAHIRAARFALGIVTGSNHTGIGGTEPFHDGCRARVIDHKRARYNTLGHKPHGLSQNTYAHHRHNNQHPQFLTSHASPRKNISTMTAG